jgi:hypothetical protein
MSYVFTIWHKFRPLGVSEMVTYRHMKFSSAGILEQSIHSHHFFCKLKGTQAEIFLASILKFVLFLY